MKKSFLIAGLMAGLIATNGFAVQQQMVTVVYTCPEGCDLIRESANGGSSSVSEYHCRRDHGYCSGPTVTILDTSANPALQSEITAQLQKQTKENVVKKRQKVSSINRAAKKLIYKEVVFDEPIVLTDKDLEDFEM